MSGDGTIVVEGEFGAVRVWLDRQGNGSRLAIQDLRSDRIGYLDALELESLAWVSHARLATVVDPAATGWATNEGTG